MASTPPAPAAIPGPASRARFTAMVVLVVVASVLAPLALTTVFVQRQLVNRDPFVATAGRLADDSAIRREVSSRVSATLISELHTEDRVRSALPDSVRALAGPLAVGADTAIRSATSDVVGSARFRSLWQTAVRATHDDVVALATGRSVHGVQTRDGRVAVELDPVVDAVVAELPAPVAALIPSASTGDSIVLLRSSDLASAQSVLRILDQLAWVLPLLCVGLYAAAIVVAPWRRPALVWAGGGLAIASGLALASLGVTRVRYLDSVPADVSRASAVAVFDIVLNPLRSAWWIAAGFGVLLAATALVVGFVRHRADVPPDDEGADLPGVTDAPDPTSTVTPAPTAVPAPTGDAPAREPVQPSRPPGRRAVPS